MIDLEKFKDIQSFGKQSKGIQKTSTGIIIRPNGTSASAIRFLIYFITFGTISFVSLNEIVKGTLTIDRFLLIVYGNFIFFGIFILLLIPMLVRNRLIIDFNTEQFTQRTLFSKKIIPLNDITDIQGLGFENPFIKFSQNGIVISMKNSTIFFLGLRFYSVFTTLYITTIFGHFIARNDPTKVAEWEKLGNQREEQRIDQEQKNKIPTLEQRKGNLSSYTFLTVILFLFMPLLSIIIFSLANKMLTDFTIDMDRMDYVYALLPLGMIFFTKRVHLQLVFI